MQWLGWIARALLLSLTLFGVGGARAATPLMTRFPPDVETYPQYFAVEQGSDEQVYLGTGDGLLRFDGLRWSRIDPASGTVRALLRDRRGRLWVGGTDHFGYLQRDADGSDRFVDIAAAFSADIGTQRFDDIWDIAEGDDGIYFRALRWLFHVDAQGNRVAVWHAPNRLGGVIWHAGELVVNWRGEGLKHRVGDHFELLPGGDAFAAQPAFLLESLDADRLLVLDQTPRLALWEQGRVRVLSDSQEHSHHLRSLKLDANLVAFSGDDGYLRIVDARDGSVRRVEVDDSFLSSVARARDGALLIAGPGGLSHLPWPPTWTVYGLKDGLRGTVHDATLVGSRLRVQTGAGEYSVDWRGNGASGTFTRLHALSGEAWALHVDGGIELLAESYGLQRVDGIPARLGPDDLYPLMFQASAFDAAVLWVGTDNGLARLQRAADGWQLTHHYSELQARVFNLAEPAAGELWLGSDDRGLLRVHIDPDGKLRDSQVIGSDFGLSWHEPSVNVLLMDGNLIASTDQGLFRWQGGRFQGDAVDGLAGLLQPGEGLAFRPGANRQLWAWSRHSVYRRDAQRHWSRINRVDAGGGGIEIVRPLPDGDAILGIGAHLLHYNAAVATPASRPPILRLSGVRLEAAEGSTRLPLNVPARIAAGSGTLVFELGLVDLTRSGPPQFQVRILGLGNEWSAWSQRAEFNYAQIPPGDYRFEARARSTTGPLLTLPAYAFAVRPAWYRHNAVILAAALVLLIGLALLMTAGQRLRIRRLDARNRELDAQIQLHTAELTRANAQLREQAERDALTGVANRHRFDAFFAQALQSCIDSQTPLALLILDVDHFKSFNDTHGHPAGDEVLRRVAETLSAAVPAETLVARLGGEEFCLVAAHLDRAGALRLAEHLRQTVADAGLGITISIGVAARIPADAATGELLMAAADAALYLAKHQGRNRVEAEASSTTLA